MDEIDGHKARDSVNIHEYKSQRGENVILGYIESLSQEEKIDGLSVLEYLERGEFDNIKSKKWQGKILEVYFYKHNRIFYIIVENTDIYLLHACKKQKNKTERHDSEIVIKRAKELENQIGKSFI